jgi:glutathione S-transferase
VHETLAVLEYVDYALGEPALLPSDLDRRARALTRLHEAASLKDAGMALFAYLMKTPIGNRDGAELSLLVAPLTRELERWEHHYAAAAWCAGDELTLADVLVFTYLATAWQLGLDLPPALEGFRRRMLARPSVRRTVPPSWSERRCDLGPT